MSNSCSKCQSLVLYLFFIEKSSTFPYSWHQELLSWVQGTQLNNCKMTLFRFYVNKALFGTLPYVYKLNVSILLLLLINKAKNINKSKISGRNILKTKAFKCII